MLLSGAFRFTFQATVILAFFLASVTQGSPRKFFAGSYAPPPIELKIFSFTDNVSPVGSLILVCMPPPLGSSMLSRLCPVSPPALSSFAAGWSSWLLFSLGLCHVLRFLIVRLSRCLVCSSAFLSLPIKTATHQVCLSVCLSGTVWQLHTVSWFCLYSGLLHVGICVCLEITQHHYPSWQT